MATYPVLNVKDLSGFSGRSEASYRNAAFAAQALSQATLLFKIGTCLTNIPDDEVSRDLVKMAILAYADHIILAQPYAKGAASPFNSESLGSYSYSKSAAAVARGDKTGVMWFDLAVERLGVCGEVDNVMDFGGIEIFENDLPMVRSVEGNLRVLSPADVAAHEAWSAERTISRN